MRRSPVDTLARVGRWTLLAGAVLALSTLGAWTFQRESVEALDAWLVQRHLAGPTRRMDEIKASYRADPAAASELAAALLQDLEGVQRGDRLEAVKREALELDARALDRQDRTEEALAATEEWIAFHPRDLRARIFRSDLLYPLEGRRQEAVAELERLFRLAPEAALVATAWIELLLREGRPLDAADAVFESDGHERSNTWLVTWTDGKPRGFVHHAELTPFLDGDRFRLEFTLTGPVESLRITFPSENFLTLVDPEFVVALRRAPIHIRLADSDVTYQRIQRSGDSFTQLNGAGASYFQIPLEETIRASRIGFFLHARLVRNPSDVALALTDHAEFGAVAEALLEAGRGEQLDVLLDARRRSLASRQFRLYWRTDGSFDREASCFGPLGGSYAGDRHEFDVEFPVGAEARNARLVFPAGEGLTFGLESIEVRAGDQELALDPETLALQVIHHLDRTGGVFTVSGRKPSISFPLPPVEGPVEAIHLRGWVR